MDNLKARRKIRTTNQHFQKYFTQSANGKIKTSKEIWDVVWWVKVVIFS